MYTPLFTSGVWRSSFNTNLIEYCDSIHKTDTGRGVSNMGGYQSNDLNLKEPLLQPLINHILQQTQSYASFLSMNVKEFVIQNMWININGYKDYNEIHTHPGCVFSGVYYIHTPSGSIEFIKESIRLQDSHWNNIEFNTATHENSTRWALPPHENMLYLFPSFYAHRVSPKVK